MAVSSRLTTFVDFNGTPTFVSYGGGQGASTNTDIFIEGTGSGGRRSDNVTNQGFGVTRAAVNLSAANMHIKAWASVTQWNSVTQLQIRISSGADDDHEVPNVEFPTLGGFIPVWVDVSRTPEVGGSANEASIGEIGILVDIGDVGGNAQNLILDEILYGTGGLLWSGAGGSLADFRTYESTNAEGVLVTQNGVDFCYARLELSDTTSTTFTDNSFTLIFPDQGLVSDTFMGITADLSNAGTSITLSNATIQSANPASAGKRPDLILSGTNGSFTSTNINWLGMRLMDLNSAASFDGGIINTIELTQGSSEIQNVNLQTNSASGVAVIDDATFGSTGIHDSTITQSGSGHFVEITSPGTYTFDNLSFLGFGSDGTNSAAVYNNSGGAVTINIINGGNNPTVRNGTGASTTVNNTVTVGVTVLDANTLSPIEGARVLVEAASGGSLAVGTDILSGVTDVNGRIEDTGFSFVSDQPISGRVRSATNPPFYQQGQVSGTITSSGFDSNVLLILDQ